MTPLLLLSLPLLPAPRPGEALRVELERWPHAEAVQSRLDFYEARRAHLLARLSWDVLHAGRVAGELARLEHAWWCWDWLRWARAAGRRGDWEGCAHYLGRLRELIGEEDYRAGRLPPLPDPDDFSEIK